MLTGFIGTSAGNSTWWSAEGDTPEPEDPIVYYPNIGANAFVASVRPVGAQFSRIDKTTRVLYTSEDFGDTWTTRGTVPTTKNIQGVEYADNIVLTVVQGTSNGESQLYQSLDNGDTLQSVISGPQNDETWYRGILVGDQYLMGSGGSAGITVWNTTSQSIQSQSNSGLNSNYIENNPAIYDEIQQDWYMVCNNNPPYGTSLYKTSDPLASTWDFEYSLTSERGSYSAVSNGTAYLCSRAGNVRRWNEQAVSVEVIYDGGTGSSTNSVFAYGDLLIISDHSAGTLMWSRDGGTNLTTFLTDPKINPILSGNAKYVYVRYDDTGSSEYGFMRIDHTRLV